MDSRLIYFSIFKCLDSDSLNYLFTQGNGSLKDYKQVYQLILAQFTNDGCSICNKHNDGKVPITKLESNIIIENMAIFEKIFKILRLNF